MKSSIIITLTVMLVAAGWGQENPVLSRQPVTRLHEPASANWQEFDQQSGRMQFQAGPAYIGGTLAYLQGSSPGITYGLAIDFLPVAVPDNYLSGYYDPTLSYAGLLVPFWFSVKLRLSRNNSSQISPYIITGVGPTLGLRLNRGNSFVNSISDIETAWGGGGYLGAGFDYLWAEEWALSFDVRYNVIRLDSPIGLDENYSGFTFAIGFVRAFGL